MGRGGVRWGSGGGRRSGGNGNANHRRRSSVYADDLGFHALNWLGRVIPFNNRLMVGGVQKRREKRCQEGRCCYSERKFG